MKYNYVELTLSNFEFRLNRVWISGHREAFGEDLASLYNRGPEELK